MQPLRNQSNYGSVKTFAHSNEPDLTSITIISVMQSPVNNSSAKWWIVIEIKIKINYVLIYYCLSDWNQFSLEFML